MSLSGYEAAESSELQEETQQSQLYDDEAEDTVTGATATPPRPASSQAGDLEDTSTLDSPSLAHAHSTPRAPRAGEEDVSFAEYPSPYESLKRELKPGSRTPAMEPTTPGKIPGLPEMSMEDSSPLVPPTSSKKLTAMKNPVLHHMLDKTYRIAATPHSARKYKPTGGFTPSTARRGAPALDKWAVDSSPPESPAPQLRADIFASGKKAPRTPGMTVQRTPGRGNQTFNNPTLTKGVFDSDSDDDDLGPSPPKTMQFHMPQSRVLQTPGKHQPCLACYLLLIKIAAREASKRIVEDLLLTAGGDMTDSTGGLEDDSPSVVRRQMDLDDSF